MYMFQYAVKFKNKWAHWLTSNLFVLHGIDSPIYTILIIYFEKLESVNGNYV